MTRLTLIVLTAFAVLVLGSRTVFASIPSSGKPTITIMNPKNGATIYGSAVTVRVAVSNFTLVPPVYLNPPKLSGNQGHIHYVLDGLANFIAKRDAAVSLSHTWTNVAPGHHTLIVYLATSQHSQFPGTRIARVSVTVAPAGSAPKAPVSTKVSPVSTKKVGIGAMPKTGGAFRAQGALDALTVLAGLLATALGLLLVCAPPTRSVERFYRTIRWR